MEKTTDINELRNRLLEAFDGLRDDPKKSNQVRAMTQAADKVLGTVKAQLQYAALRGEQPEIDFLGKTSGKPLVTGAHLRALEA